MFIYCILTCFIRNNRDEILIFYEEGANISHKFFGHKYTGTGMSIPQSLLEQSIQINIQQALQEDIGDGDITAMLTLKKSKQPQRLLPVKIWYWRVNLG
jgi:nicotinate-nucleotide pyrophosphorylase (carboxylating)